MKVEVQFISHSNGRYTYEDSIRLALEGGCRWVQLRMKDASEEDVRRVARNVKKMCDDAGATFIIDDRVELVKEVGADGVHLGKKDMPISQARDILGNDFIIGGTANTFSEVEKIARAGGDYVGSGPFRFTSTKKGLAPVLGLEGYRSIVRDMKEAGIHIPVVAIGGITAEDIPSILETGVDSVALSGAVLNADDPVAEMKRILEVCESINKSKK